MSNDKLPQFSINLEIRADSDAILDESFDVNTLKGAFDQALVQLPELIIRAGTEAFAHELAAALKNEDPSYTVSAETTVSHARTFTEVDVKVTFSL